MKIIKVIKLWDHDQLFSNLRRVKLVGHGQPEVYEKSSMALLTVDPNNIFPAQRYVLSDNVDVLNKLYKQVLCFGYDIFALDGVIHFWVEGSEIPVPIAPPVVEVSFEHNDTVPPVFPLLNRGLHHGVPLINDGMHRVFAAKALGKNINVVLVDNPSHPYYATAVEGSWENVSVLESIPRDFVKKTYRDPDNYKALFRDFNAIIPGIQAKRQRS